MIKTSDVEIRLLDNYKYVKLTKPFIFSSDILNREVAIPAGFICDFESVPVLKGTSRRAGLCHDYLYRINSCPVVSKGIADDVYLEIMKHRRISAWRRYIKFWAVKLFGKSSYHRLKVEATIDEIP